ncbi:hypothetical protein DHEL01_v212973 [Diaporthe helianthi]|uniref:Uncharacterized protein n=1 Tax=Diaporthe helianthi TaxID=158607 RepID=A0A2P5HEF6_DIAHE|nr:hypothetical protein DHEL01_v212973 [Diaporthe helianthi]
MDTYSNFAGVPAIDASILNDEPSAERKKLLQILVASLFTHGAIRITGHGLAACKIQRAFESLKLSAACSRSEGGLCRGYRGLQAHTGDETTMAYEYESFSAGPSYDRQAPTPWPIGIIEEALGLYDDELVSRWSHRNGEVRTKHRTSSLKGQVEGLMTGLPEGESVHPMLMLVFQETRGGEIVVVCGTRIRKWIQNQLLSSSGAKKMPQAEECICLRPAKYSMDFVGYEDMHNTG